MTALGNKKAADIVRVKTALYRHYNADGVLLYVGVSLSPMARTSSHSSYSEWFDSVARIDIEWHENRLEALKAEKQAIQSELPTQNKIYSIKPVDKSASIFGPFLPPETTQDIIQQAGGVDVVSAKFGKKREYVQRLQYGDKLPASWFAALEVMTKWELPRSLFSFQGLDQ